MSLQQLLIILKIYLEPYSYRHAYYHAHYNSFHHGSSVLSCIEDSLWTINIWLITPCTCARGKVTGLYVDVGTKIAKSGDLGIWKSCKHSSIVKIGEKLALLYVSNRSVGLANARNRAFWSATPTNTPPVLVLHYVVSIVHAQAQFRQRSSSQKFYF